MKFLAAVDLSEASLLALEALRALAGEEVGDVTLLHVVDLDLYTAGGSVPGIMDFARERLQQESERLSGCGLGAPTIRIEQGDSTQTILRVAVEERADLIVMTNLGKGARTGRLFGSTAERVASTGKTPVLITRLGLAPDAGDRCSLLSDGNPFERTLAAVDLEHDPAALVDALAALPGVGAVRFINVVENANAVAETKARLDSLQLPPSGAVHTQIEVLVGEPAQTILADAADWGATAIALRPCAHSVPHRALWGSVAREVALKSKAPLLFVPPVS